MTALPFKHKLRHWLVARISGQLVVQITDRCNARCPQCGMRISSSFKRRTLFIDARTGDTFPCGFRGGDNFGKPIF